MFLRSVFVVGEPLATTSAASSSRAYFSAFHLLQKPFGTIDNTKESLKIVLESLIW